VADANDAERGEENEGPWMTMVRLGLNAVDAATRQDA
jgi:hypothetical protein